MCLNVAAGFVIIALVLLLVQAILVQPVPDFALKLVGACTTTLCMLPMVPVAMSVNFMGLNPCFDGFEFAFKTPGSLVEIITLKLDVLHLQNQLILDSATGIL